MLFIIGIIVFVYLYTRYFHHINKKIKKYSVIFLSFLSTQMFVISSFLDDTTSDFNRYLFLTWTYSYLTLLLFSLFSITVDIFYGLSYLAYPEKLINFPIFKFQMVALFLSMLIIGLAMYNGKKVPNIKRFNIETVKVDKDFKIIQLTDLHLGRISNTKWLKKVIEKVNNENADIVLITGDFADGKSKNYINTVKLFSEIKSKNGVYAITGNHEYYYDYQNWLELYKKENIKFLFNEKITFKNIEIFGVPDQAAKRLNEIMPDLSGTLKNQDKNKFRILLDHRPGSFKKNSEEKLIDLQLSGHTHGGMVPILKNVVAKYNNGYVGGIYKNNGAILNLSNGAGIWAGFSLRINDDSEINVITIKHKNE